MNKRLGKHSGHGKKSTYERHICACVGSTRGKQHQLANRGKHHQFAKRKDFYSVCNKESLIWRGNVASPVCISISINFISCKAFFCWCDGLVRSIVAAPLLYSFRVYSQCRWSHCPGVFWSNACFHCSFSFSWHEESWVLSRCPGCPDCPIVPVSRLSRSPGVPVSRCPVVPLAGVVPLLQIYRNTL